MQSLINVHDLDISSFFSNKALQQSVGGEFSQQNWDSDDELSLHAEHSHPLGGEQQQVLAYYKNNLHESAEKAKQATLVAVSSQTKYEEEEEEE